MIETIRGLLESQLVGGGLFLMVVGSAMAMMRRLPSAIVSGIRRRFVVSVEITNTESTFRWLVLWLHEQPFAETTRRLQASSGRRRHQWDDDDDDEQPIYYPAVGNHWFTYKGRLIWFRHTREDGGQRHTPFETITLYTIGRNADFLKGILQEAHDLTVELRKGLSVHVVGTHGWREMTKVSPRSLESVVLAEDVKGAVLDDLTTFVESRPRYESLGVPWRRGYLLYGPPGTGKTSLISALSGHFKMNLYVLHLGIGVDDTRLTELLLEVPERSFVLLEDVDAALPDREENKGVTMSGLLNAIDGVASGSGRVLFMTTNCPDKLDPALVRPGRVDMQVELKPCTVEQVDEMRARFRPDLNLVDVLSGLDSDATPADVQKFLMQDGRWVHAGVETL